MPKVKRAPWHPANIEHVPGTTFHGEFGNFSPWLCVKVSPFARVEGESERERERERERLCVKTATLAQRRDITPFAQVSKASRQCEGDLPLCYQPKAQSVQFQRFCRDFKPPSPPPLGRCFVLDGIF